jgi:hypothetical protein
MGHLVSSGGAPELDRWRAACGRRIGEATSCQGDHQPDPSGTCNRGVLWHSTVGSPAADPRPIPRIYAPAAARTVGVRSLDRVFGCARVTQRRPANKSLELTAFSVVERRVFHHLVRLGSRFVCSWAAAQLGR